MACGGDGHKMGGVWPWLSLMRGGGHKRVACGDIGHKWVACGGGGA